MSPVQNMKRAYQQPFCWHALLDSAIQWSAPPSRHHSFRYSVVIDGMNVTKLSTFLLTSGILDTPETLSFLFFIHVHSASCTFGFFVPAIPSFSIICRFLGNYLWYLLNTLSLVSLVLFSFDDFMLHHSRLFVNTFFNIFYYFLFLFHFSTNIHTFRGWQASLVSLISP